MTELEFSIAIEAPAARVWNCMLDPLTYRDWTRAFAEGSYFEGSWQAGQRIQFLDPRGFGMEGVVDENRLHELIVLRLVGEIRDGKPLADSRLHREPAHERYVFNPTPAGGTLLVVHLQGWDGFLDFLKATWPPALQRLKALAESPH